jgi:hypothetical protein
MAKECTVSEGRGAERLPCLLLFECTNSVMRILGPGGAIEDFMAGLDDPGGIRESSGRRLRKGLKDGLCAPAIRRKGSL